jgi:ubiquinone/menaquinone biosynthesis C-methylase UbiE
LKIKTEYTSHHKKSLIKKIIWKVIDSIDYLLGRGSNELVPPRSITHFTTKQWKDYGKNFRNYFINFGKINPRSKILDVGCGIGSAAIGLTEYLSEGGEYYGFDIDQLQVNWCKSNVTTKFNNFHFMHADIKNFNYNPDGKYEAKNYNFPYDDNEFDFVYLLSVFTHMYTPDMENYLKEIARVLKPGGKCFITYFLINKDSEQLIADGKSSQNLIHDIGGCITSNLANPEEANGFREKHIIQIYQNYGLKISEPIKYGSWCGRESFTDYQDIVIASKL